MSNNDGLSLPPIAFAQQASRATSNAARKLACLRCQRRKVKCDHNIPCINCMKAGAQCVQVETSTRQRRRRFPERDLLTRLRHYEDLLRQNGIPFEPLHPSKPGEEPARKDLTSSDSPGVAKPSPNGEADFPEALNFWQTIRDRSDESDDDEEEQLQSDRIHYGNEDPTRAFGLKVLYKAFDSAYKNRDLLLFGSPKHDLDLATMHPQQVHIFKLWQIYLDNVNPIFKVIHAPSLQSKIIDAAGDVTNIDPILEALMFSIYCVAVYSLEEDECNATFGVARTELLQYFQQACQQALQNCGLLRTLDLQCLTAFFLFLVSCGFPSRTDPRALSTLVGAAIRIATCIGIADERKNSKCTVFEAEMRRRLWWAMAIFDSRVCELANTKSTTLTPIWTCQKPTGANDVDMGPDITSAPTLPGLQTEAMYVVVRSELADIARNSAFHLDYINPHLKALARETIEATGDNEDQLAVIRQSIEDKYLKFCNPEIPLQFVVLWSSRGVLAKNSLMHSLSQQYRFSTQKTEAWRDRTALFALEMLDCDLKLMTTPLVKKFRWHTRFYWPLPAFVYLLQDQNRRPMSSHVQRGWDLMSQDFAARADYRFGSGKDNTLFNVFTKLVLGSWKRREDALRQANQPVVIPGLVQHIRSHTKFKQEEPNMTGLHESAVVSDSALLSSFQQTSLDELNRQQQEQLHQQQQQQQQQQPQQQIQQEQDYLSIPSLDQQPFPAVTSFYDSAETMAATTGMPSWFWDTMDWNFMDV